MDDAEKLLEAIQNSANHEEAIKAINAAFDKLNHAAYEDGYSDGESAGQSQGYDEGYEAAEKADAE